MKVIVTLTTEIQQYAEGTTSVGTVVNLIVPAGVVAIPPQTILAGTDAAEFDNVPDGVGYTASAQLLDGNSAPLGALATSAPFNVTTPMVGIATPISISIAVS
jgi:hypothetical protein